MSQPVSNAEARRMEAMCKDRAPKFRLVINNGHGGIEDFRCASGLAARVAFLTSEMAGSAAGDGFTLGILTIKK
jgi:hypothetical protein